MPEAQPALTHERLQTPRSYLDASERRGALYSDADGWARTAILNGAAPGRFSSDRTIAEYAAEI
jgi:glycogen phosphorylase